VHNEGRVLSAGTGIRQAAAYSLIQGFLETLPSMLHGITQQLLYIRIESNCGTHDSRIMSAAGFAVKMLALSYEGISRRMRGKKKAAVTPQSSWFLPRDLHPITKTYFDKV
jgi:hypothetical protein